jgi:hypothetical protein
MPIDPELPPPPNPPAVDPPLPGSPPVAIASVAEPTLTVEFPPACPLLPFVLSAVTAAPPSPPAPGDTLELPPLLRLANQQHCTHNQ